MTSERSVAIVAVTQVVPMDDPASILVVGTVTSGNVVRGSIAMLGEQALATVSGLREMTNSSGTFVGVLMRCRSIEDTRQWLDAPLQGKSIVFRSAF